MIRDTNTSFAATFPSGGFELTFGSEDALAVRLNFEFGISPGALTLPEEPHLVYTAIADELMKVSQEVLRVPFGELLEGAEYGEHPDYTALGDVFLFSYSIPMVFPNTVYYHKVELDLGAYNTASAANVYCVTLS